MTMCVAEAAVDAHLAQGGYLGECKADEVVPSSELALIVLKLEEIKILLDTIEGKVQFIHEHYQNKGEENKAMKWQRVMGAIDDTQLEVDEMLSITKGLGPNDTKGNKLKLKNYASRLERKLENVFNKITGE
ncbi:MAG: hypothetical protein KAW41_06200 [Candidatus Diapherotrites archaeon]|nr:hypothetical protein [Candidatus Diapherotrites archaeon]